MTRSTSEQRFFMRPGEKTNNNFIYCLAEAANRFGLVTLMVVMMSNHYHVVIYDPHGRIVEFEQRFHSLFARSQNALLGRGESFWSSAQTSLVHLEDLGAVIEAVAYTVLNPVAANLVEHWYSWPGPQAFGALLTGRPLTAIRPAHFFDEDGAMPEEVTLELGIPPELGDAQQIIGMIKARVDAEEALHTAKRRAAGRKVLGRARVLRQSWRDAPATLRTPNGDISPRVSARDKWRRIHALERDSVFQRAYRRNLLLMRAGVPFIFPAGTYWLHRFMNVPVDAHAC